MVKLTVQHTGQVLKIALTDYLGSIFSDIEKARLASYISILVYINQTVNERQSCRSVCIKHVGALFGVLSRGV